MTTTHTKHTCSCGGSFEVVDEQEESMTVRCLDCPHYSLIIDHQFVKLCIHLAVFHHIRGERPDRRRLDDLRMATELVECLKDDVWPSWATITDFGIASSSHLGALQHAVRYEVTAYDLDRVMGDGAAITQLVRGTPEQPYAFVEFWTPWDGIAFPSPEDGD